MFLSWLQLSENLSWRHLVGPMPRKHPIGPVVCCCASLFLRAMVQTPTVEYENSALILGEDRTTPQSKGIL